MGLLVRSDVAIETQPAWKGATSGERQPVKGHTWPRAQHALAHELLPEGGPVRRGLNRGDRLLWCQLAQEDLAGHQGQKELVAHPVIPRPGRDGAPVDRLPVSDPGQIG
jgi:hypothetical protein